MRNRLGGGIVEFYRMQATGEIPDSPVAPRVARDTSGSADTMEETVLRRNVIEAVAQGNQIHCNFKQYPKVRAALLIVTERKPGVIDESLPTLAMREIARLDALFANSTGHLKSQTETPIGQEINTTASSTGALSAVRRDHRLARTEASAAKPEGWGSVEHEGAP
jgi:hypothetical protein